LILGLAVLSITFFNSCNDVEKLQPTLDQSVISSSVTSETSEGLMEFAPQTPNPYTILNMQIALDSLIANNELNCDVSKFNIRVTHKYIKFKPQDSIQFGQLIQDTTLILFDYPMDRKLTKAGTYYKDPSLTEEQPNFQWTCVPVGKVLPSGIPYDLLADLYLPEEDSQLVQYYETAFDECITKLIETSLKLTGNWDTTENRTTVTSGGYQYKKLPTKWTPAGRIRLSDDVLNNTTGLRGVKARAHRWFEVREQLTDVNGDFNVGHQFRYDVNYSIKWERNNYNIRSGRHGQAYFNGPKQKGNWNLDILNGVSWHYGQVHRGAFEYYYNNQTGLRSPPTIGFLGSRLSIGVFDDCDRANYRHWQRLWLGPEIRMYTKRPNCAARNSQEQFRTIIHELAHASHFNISHWHFRNSANMVQESWALGAAWAFERLRYPADVINFQNLRLQNAPLIDGVRFDVVNWGERQYTPVVIDLVDNDNQRATWGFGNTDFPIDNVSGYSIRNIEDALVQKRTMDAWRDQLKTNKPNLVTDTQVDDLFNNYTPLQ
jgi:hypothetical protein